MRLADGARAVWARTRSLTPPSWLGPFGREPWIVLGPLILVQWLALIVFMVTVRHNSWLYYQGGDQTFYWTTGWSFAHWRLPTAEVGWGWSYLLSPLAGITGNTVLSGLPGIILVDTLVLLPVALLGMYGIGARIAGRVFGYWTAGLWIALPYVAIPLFVQRYHGKYIEQTLPQTFGLTPLADFPSMVLLIVAAYLVVRALDTRDWREAVLAGLVVGFAFCVKPSNAIFFAAPLAAFLIARRWRQVVYFGAAMLPGLLLVRALEAARARHAAPVRRRHRRRRSRRWPIPLGLRRARRRNRALREHRLAAPPGQQGLAAGVLLGGQAPSVGRDRRRGGAAAALVGEGGARRRLVLRLPHRQGHLRPRPHRGRELLPPPDAELPRLRAADRGRAATRAAARRGGWPTAIRPSGRTRAV